MSDASIQYQQTFNHLQYHADHMNTWEQGFVDSLEHQFKQKGKLSISQERHLLKLADKYNMDKIREAQQWVKNYGPEQRDIAIKCAKYYDGQYVNYFHDIVTKVLDDPEGHVLSLGEYNKLCKNKYALKVLASYDAPEKFAVGDMVQIRANNRVDIANTDQKTGAAPRGAWSTYKLSDKTCMVLEVNALPITRAAKNSRVYKVLIIDETSPIYVHESDLKKLRRRKKK
tara:strand:+ start:70 stop:753 length:684 start_codon:yes stop_codon:yes gene_type:complete